MTARLFPLLILALGSAYLWFVVRWSDRYQRWLWKGIYTPKPWHLDVMRWGGIAVSLVFILAGLVGVVHPQS